MELVVLTLFKLGPQEREFSDYSMRLALPQDQSLSKILQEKGSKSYDHKWKNSNKILANQINDFSNPFEFSKSNLANFAKMLIKF